MTLDCSAPYHHVLLGLQGLQYKDTGFDDRTSPSCPTAQAQTSLLRYRLTYVGSSPRKQAPTALKSPQALQALPEALLCITGGPGPCLGISGMTFRQADSKQKLTSGKPRGRLSQQVSRPGRSEVRAPPGSAQPSTSQLRGLFPLPKARGLGA